LKKAFLFPGQGAQEVGMARDLFAASPHFGELVDLGSELTGEDLASLCRRGPERKLRRSFFLQPVMVAVSLGYRQCLAEHGVEADAVVGHSLGEISALSAAGVIPAEVAVTVAAKRGELMDRAAAEHPGGMTAVLSVAREDLERLVEELGDRGKIAVANDNAPGQIVISGRAEQLKQVSDAIKERRMGRCRELAVSGAWHGPWMAPARKSFEEWIEAVEFSPPRLPLILNATGEREDDPVRIKELISRELTSPVLWRQCMDKLLQMGVDTLLEVGPGRVLAGLARLNGFGAGSQVFNVNNLQGVRACVRAGLGKASVGDAEETRQA
jgi:[acyl-carrier-protein] S-malonyltransferase